MTFKTNILASDEAQYLDADNVKTERTCLSKNGKHVVLWKIGTKYYVEINTYYDENFWQGEDNAFERSEYIIEVKELTNEEVEEYFKEFCQLKKKTDRFIIMSSIAKNGRESGIKL